MVISGFLPAGESIVLFGGGGGRGIWNGDNGGQLPFPGEKQQKHGWLPAKKGRMGEK